VIEQPLVSVIVPVHNSEAFLDECLGSIFAQTLAPGRLQVVAVDDGSTDSSWQRLQSMAAEHPNLVLDHFEVASGSAAAPRNRGLELATGKYVFFVDSDDWIEPDAMEKATVLAEISGSKTVLLKMGSFGSERDRHVPSAIFSRPVFAEDFVDSGAFKTLGCWKLFDREVLESHQIRFPTGYRIGEDQAFTIQAYVYGNHVSTLNDKVYYWLRHRDDGTSVTQAGQDGRKYLQKNLELIEVILRITEPGERRDKLLSRALLARDGLRATFAAGRFVEEFDAAEQEALVAQVRPIVAPLWNDRVRRGPGTAKTRLMCELLVAGDVAGLREVSQASHDRKLLNTHTNPITGKRRYVSPGGTVVDDLDLTPSRLTQLKKSVKGLIGR
jgi:glycosyltransferase involved in cell wall biosynthesis